MDISKAALRKEVDALLKNADLTTMTSKLARQQVEKKLGCNLISRKKEIDGIVMEFVTKSQTDGSTDEISSEKLREEVEAVLKGADLATMTAKAVREKIQLKLNCSLLRRKKEIDEIVMAVVNERDEEDEEDMDTSDDEKPEPTAKKTTRKQKSTTAEKKKKSSKTATPGVAKKANGFTRPLKLSPELSALMGGADSLPRHEVVKKVWALIKERNLYDPKNKQFAICDPELMKVMKIKRFRTFGMLKYLKDHFLD